MKKRRNWGPMLIALPILWMSGIVMWVGCDSVMYPTVADVNTLAEADRDYQDGLHAGQIDTLTEQHAAMAPEVRAELDAIVGQYNALSAQLREKAGGVTAKGVELGGFGGELIPKLMSMFGFGSLIPIYSMFFGKSRAQKEIDELKSKLAVSAPAGEAFPGESAKT